MKRLLLLSSFILGALRAISCDGMSASVLSNVYMGNNQYQLTIQYCESVSNGAGVAVSGIILQTTGGTVTGTATPSFTSNSTGVTINYNQINSNTVQWGEWDDNPNVPDFLSNGNATQCFTMVINTTGAVTSVAISGSSASSDIGAGFVTWFGRYCCKLTLSVPPVVCSSSWTAPQICPGSGPIDLDNYTSLTGVFSGPGVNSATGVFDPSATTLPASITFTVGDAGLNCSTVHPITSNYTISPVADQTICAGQSVTLSTSASTSLPCNYTLNLQDQAGDGWQGGANVNVYINGVLYGNYTLASGSSSNISLPVSTGDVISMTYTAGTSWNSENRIRILNSAGTVVYTSGYGPSSGSLGSGITASCGTNTSFTYAWTPSTGLSTTTGSSTVATPSTTTAYTVTATNTVTGCALTETATITVTNGVTPTFTPINYVCQNDPAPTLPTTSNNGITGVWTPAVSTATPGSATYTFTPNAGQCASTATMTITTLGAQRIAPLGAQCSVGTLNFEALPNPGPAGITYSWQVTPPPGITATPTTGSGQTFSTQATNTTNAPVIFTSPNQISVTMTIGGVTCVRTFGPTINPAPFITDQTSTICSGQAFSITPVNGAPNIVPTSTTYTWTVVDNPNVTGESAVSVGQTFIGQTLNNTSTTNQDVVYTVTPVSGAAGACPGPTFTVTVTVQPAITPAFSPILPLCVGAVAPVLPTTSTNGVAGTWDPPTVSTATEGITTYTFTPSLACSPNQTMDITINPLPVVDAGFVQPVCEGTQITLSATGASSYTWNNGATQGLAFTPPVGQNTYEVIGTSAEGCTATDQVVVNVNPIPVVNAGIDVSICITGSTTLTATGATTYSWAPDGQTTASITVSPSTNTTYIVTGTTAGCTASDAVVVSVLDNAPINAGPDLEICDGASTTLTATGGDTYTWSTSETTDEITVSPITTTTYIVTGTDANGCVGSDDVEVVVNPLPVVDAGLVQPVCEGTQITLSATGATTYTWNNGATQGIAFIPPVGQTTYEVTGTDDNGCSSTASVMVIVNPLPIIDAGTDQTVCENTQVTLTASGAPVYSWDNSVADGVPFTPPVGQNTYEVIGTTAAGCTATDQVVVTVNPLPIVDAGTDQTVCEGIQVTLTALGASTYSWNNGVTQGIAFTPSVGQSTYEVTGTSAEGCTDTDQVLVTVNSNPSPVIQGPNSYCTGNFAVLSTTQPYTSYNWSTGSTNATTNATIANNPITVSVINANGCTGTSPSFTVSENSIIIADFTVTICQGETALIHGVSQSVANIYSQTFTTPSGCDSVSNVTLVVNPLPNVDAGPDVEVCLTQQVTPNATGASTYQWSGGLTNGVPFTPAATSIYIVTGTSAAGCTNTDQVSVTVNSLPNVNAGSDQEACIGETVTISGSGATTYTWNNGVTNGVAFVPAGTTTYTVTGTDGNGCTNTDQIMITVNPLPNIDAGPDQTVCEDVSVTLSATGGVSYTWDNGVTNGVPFAPALGSVTYTVSGTDIKGCTNTDQVEVNVNPLPIANAGPDQTVCLGAAVTLTASGAVTYSWSGGITNGQAFTPAAGTTTYTVTGTSSEGCTDTDQVTVIVNPLPIVDAGLDQSVCDGTQVTLTATGVQNFSWTGGVSNGVAFTPAAGTTTYTVSGTDANGCVNTDAVNVTVNPIPNVIAGNDVVVCDGQTVILTASGANTYSWTGGVNQGVGFVPTLGTTTYSVTGTSTAGCTNTDQVDVTVNPTPVVSFTPDQTIGCTPMTVNFTNNTAGASNCVWSFSNGTTLTGCGTVPVTFTQGGCYDASLTTTVNGCTSTFSADNIVCVEEPPIAEFAPSSNAVSNLNTEVFFNNQSVGASTYSWNFGDESQASTIENPTHIYPADEETNYTIMLIAASPIGCLDTAYSTIQVYEELIFYVPNTFTPDDDDYNPIFQPVFTAGFDPYDYTLYIFNRWGEIIFESHDATVGWDGSYGSNDQVEMCQDGVYTWKIEFKVTRWDERRQAVGHVNLIR